MTVIFNGLEGIRAQLGKPIGPGEWVEVDQARINEFASCSGDHQWIHVDVEKANTGPYGTTIAHGLLTLSMIGALNAGLFKFEGFKMGVNYGYSKIRFPTPVPVGSALRVVAKVLSCEEIKGGVVETVIEFNVEREGSDKPACVAEMIFRHYPL